MSFSIMTQCLPGTISHYDLLAAPITTAEFKWICPHVGMFLYSSCFVHITGVHSDDRVGQRKAQSIQQGVQGLPKRPDGHYPAHSLTMIDT